MTTIVCRQGLGSCLESQLVGARTQRLTLSLTRPQFCQPLELAIKSCFFDSNTKQLEEKCCCEVEEEGRKETDFLHGKHISSNPDLGSWSFLEALSISNGPQSSKEMVEKENSYVHPLAKRSLSSLSDKSLELCTENLGNETGSGILEDNIFSLSSSDSEGGNSPTRKQSISHQLLGAKKKSISPNFPPPLTTISGSGSLQLRPHREAGRLVIKAVKAPPANTLFQAERSNGRLRLCLLKDSTQSFDYEEETSDKGSEGRSEDNKEEFEDDSNYEAQEKEEEKEEKEETDGKRTQLGGEMGIKDFHRGRCIEGEHEKNGLLNLDLEPFWVATS